MKNNSNNDSRKILTLIVLIVTLMVCETGATFAYFQLSANAVGNITGTAASGGLAFTVTPNLIAPTGTYATKPLVPQYAYRNSKNVLQAAVTGVTPPGGSAAVPCVDANGNAICRVYTFTIKNNATSTVQVNGRIYFANATTNLKWALMTGTATVSVTGTTTATNLRSTQTSAQCTASTATTNKDCWFDIGEGETDNITGRSLAPNATRQYSIVTWINETGAVQTDSGTWTATIEFTSSNGTGITSTIVTGT